MSHASSLFAVSLFLLVWHAGRGCRTVRGWVGLGLAAGLMVLVRELNWLFLLVPAVDEAIDIVMTVSQRRGGNRVQLAGLSSRSSRSGDSDISRSALPSHLWSLRSSMCTGR